MPLWDLKDTANGAPNYLSFANSQPAANTSRDYYGVQNGIKKDDAFFVDTTEMTVASNIAKGIKTPGWNLYRTYTDSNGNTRHKVEPLVVAKVTAAVAGDLGVTGNTTIEDATVADV